MSLQALKVPKWGLSMEEGAVVEWHVAEGAEVGVGDELLEVETSKIANAVESPVAGRVVRIVAQPGETLAVGGLLAVIAQAGASPDAAEIDAFVADFQASFVPGGDDEGGSSSGPQTLEIDGARISYLTAGGGEATPLVLVHGFGGDANNWLFNLTELAVSRPVFALDLPGHGASTKAVGEGSVAALAEALLGFLAALKLPQVHLAGHSLGGAVALEATRRAPERVASLALLAPAGLGERINGGYLQGFIAAQSRRDMKPVLAQLFCDQALVSRDMIEDILKYKRLDGVTEALETLSAGIFPAGRQAAALRGVLEDPARPVLVIWGREDAIASPADADGLPAHVRVEVLDSVGHMPHMEAAGQVNRLLQEHLG
ncbi:MAG: acetoin dehydrogenase dihydrolipoyllysine-residue acetyltransferase subunit [Gammaproteobacteria bacterium]|nr:acetoin dehydrogenase dihydrolipoyllysine-residue acetyltransferase subunit [Gammaproteobacteria bacterium]